MKITLESKGLLFATTTAIMWGLLAVALEIILKWLSPLNIVFFRFFFSFVALLAIVLIKKPQILKGPFPTPAILSGLMLASNYLAFVKGMQYTSPSYVQIIIQIGPITLAMAGVFLFKEKISLSQKWGFFLALVGFSIFYHQQISNVEFNKGVLWILIAAFSWAIYAIIQKKISAKYSNHFTNLVIYGVASICFIPFVNVHEYQSIQIEHWPIIIFAGANTLIAYGCLAEAFLLAPANKISMIITLNPILTIVIMQLLNKAGSHLVRQENLNISSFMGTAIVIFGAILVVGKNKRSA